MRQIRHPFSILHSALCIALAAFSVSAATTGLYVQDGLIACWDGIENFGRGIHNGNTNVWKDVVAGREFALTNVTVKGDRMTFAGEATSYGELNSTDTEATFGRAQNGTLEIVYASDTGTGNQFMLQSTESSGNLLCIWNGDKLLSSNGQAHQSPGFSYTSGTKTNDVSVRYSAAKPIAAFANGVSLTKTTSAYWGAGNDKTTIGTRSNKAANSHFKGSIYCIRLYSRQLTDVEIAANHDVDDMRFKYGLNDTCLAVIGSPIDLGSPSPAFGVTNGLAAGASFTVSCGAAVGTDAAGTTQYSCTGWKLYDDANVVSSGAGTSFTYVHPTPAKYRRLEWQWEVTAYRGTIAAGCGGAISQAGTGWFAVGTPVTVTATPDAGGSFIRWTGTLPAGASSSSASTTFTPTAPFDMKAVFETLGNGGLVFVNEKTSSYWHTATNCVLTLPIEFPAGASSATLSVTGTGYSAQYAIPAGTAQYPLSLPPATSPTTENVYDLTLAFNDSASTVRTAKLGLIDGYDATTAGRTRCLAPVTQRKWGWVRGRVVIPIPYGSEPLAIGGTTIDTGLDGAQGWYPLFLRGGQSAALTLDSGASATLYRVPEATSVIVR